MASDRKAAVRKQSVNLSVRIDLIKEAKAFGTNMSALLERALEDAHRERRQKLWQDENRAPIEAWNTWIEENGLPFDELRPW